MSLLLNRELVSRAKLRLVIVFPDIVKDCPEIRNLPKIFLRSFENVAPEIDLLNNADVFNCLCGRRRGKAEERQAFLCNV